MARINPSEIHILVKFKQPCFCWIVCHLYELFRDSVVLLKHGCSTSGLDSQIVTSLIPMFRPRLPSYSQLEKYITVIDSSRQYSNFGPLESEVRLRFSEYLRLPIENIVTCSNATLGINGAISTSSTSGIWSLPSWTFTATAAALNQARGTGFFLDIDHEWRAKPSKDYSNLVDVLPFGQPVGTSKRYVENNVHEVVIDAAASFDSLLDQSWAEFPRFAAILSFHATKVLPAAEGGLFFSNSTEWAEQFRNWTRFGMQTGRVSFSEGTNAKMSEYHSAVLLASLDNWISDRKEWIAQISRANQLATKYGYRSNPHLPKECATPYWIVQHENPAAMEKLKRTFEAQKIETRAWWEYGCHKMPAYSHFLKGDLSTTDLVARQTLGLPFWIDMENEVWEAIERAFQRAVSK